MDTCRRQVKACMAKYPELLKLCTTAETDTVSSNCCRCEGCLCERLQCRDPASGLADGVHAVGLLDGRQLRVADSDSKPIPGMDVAEKCLSWIRKCSDMDFFRTFPEVSLLYSPYSAVTVTEYTDGGATPPAAVTLYPGGATVPEHCLTWSHVGVESSVWKVPDIHRADRVLDTGRRPNLTDPYPVPTSCSSQVFHTEAAYSNRRLKPELVPSDLSSGKSYHQVSVGQYMTPSTEKISNKHGRDPVKDPLFVDQGGRTTPGIGTESGTVPTAGYDGDGSVTDETSAMAETTNGAAEEAVDVDERPDSVLSQIRPGSSLGDYDGLFRPDSGLSNCDHSLMRPDSSLSQYDNSTYDGSNHDHSVRPDSAFSHFSEFDSGIDEFRTHSTTPPPGSRPGSSQNQSMVFVKNYNPDAPVGLASLKLGRDVCAMDAGEVRTADPDSCHEHQVSSTTDDVECVIGKDAVAPEIVDHLLGDESILSGSTCSSGHLMIDTNSELEEELTCELNSDTDSEADPEQTRSSPLNMTVRMDPCSLNSFKRKDIHLGVAALASSDNNNGNGLRRDLGKSERKVTQSVTSPSKSVIPGSIHPDGLISQPVADNPVRLGYMPGAHLSGYMYNHASSGVIPNPINMGYVPTPAGVGCLSSHSSMAGMHGTARMARVPATTSCPLNPQQIPQTGGSVYPGSYPYYQPMWNYYPGMHPFVSPATQYMNCMPWVMGYPGYYPPHVSYARSGSGYTMAPSASTRPPLGTPLDRPQDVASNATKASIKRKRQSDAGSDTKRRHI